MSTSRRSRRGTAANGGAQACACGRPGPKCGTQVGRRRRRQQDRAGAVGVRHEHLPGPARAGARRSSRATAQVLGPQRRAGRPAAARTGRGARRRAARGQRVAQAPRAGLRTTCAPERGARRAPPAASPVTTTARPHRRAGQDDRHGVERDRRAPVAGRPGARSRDFAAGPPLTGSTTSTGTRSVGGVTGWHHAHDPLAPGVRSTRRSPCDEDGRARRRRHATSRHGGGERDRRPETRPAWRSGTG